MKNLYQIIKEEVDNFLKEWGSENKLFKVEKEKSSNGGDLYVMDIFHDSFIHLTDFITADYILKNKTIPAKEGKCSAVSTTFGEIKPKKGDVALFFTTLVLPEGEHSVEEVSWKKDVKCSNITKISLDKAFDLVNRSSEKISDKNSDFVIYNSNYLEESN